MFKAEDDLEEALNTMKKALPEREAYRKAEIALSKAVEEKAKAEGK